MGRDEIGKLSGQRGQGGVKSTGKTDLGLLVLEIKLQLLKPTRNLTSLELNIPNSLYITGINYYKGFVYALSHSETIRPQT